MYYHKANLLNVKIIKNQEKPKFSIFTLDA